MSGLPVDSTTIFPDELTARKYREVLLPPKQQQDGTIPRTPTELRAHVKVLFKAFKVVRRDCACRQGIKDPFLHQIHDNRLVECLCWEILQACITRSEKDANLVEAWEPNKFKFKKEEKTFAQRFDDIVKTMSNSKTICKHLFDVKYVLKIVDDPKTSLERVVANRKLNGVKAEIMKRGKEAKVDDEKKPKRRKTNTDADNEDTDNSPPVTYQPRRQRSSAISGVANQPFITPNRSATAQTMSAPATYNSMMPPRRPTPSLHPSPLLQPGNLYHNNPLRMPSGTPNMNMSSRYGTGFHAPQTPTMGFASFGPMPRTIQTPTPMFNSTGYPSGLYGSDASTGQLRHTSRQQSVTSSQATTPTDRSGSSFWLSQPMQETYGPSYGRPMRNAAPSRTTSYGNGNISFQPSSSSSPGITYDQQHDHLQDDLDQDFHTSYQDKDDDQDHRGAATLNLHHETPQAAPSGSTEDDQEDEQEDDEDYNLH